MLRARDYTVMIHKKVNPGVLLVFGFRIWEFQTFVAEKEPLERG